MKIKYIFSALLACLLILSMSLIISCDTVPLRVPIIVNQTDENLTIFAELIQPIGSSTVGSPHTIGTVPSHTIKKVSSVEVDVFFGSRIYAEDSSRNIVFSHNYTGPEVIEIINDRDNIIVVTIPDNNINYPSAITPSAGKGGSISPVTRQFVDYGDDRSFVITADAGYNIASVIIDDTAITPVPTSPYTYTFTNVTANHTISATFNKVNTS